MAKKAISYNFKGRYNHALGVVTETTKEGEFAYDLQTVLEEFDGKDFTISIKEDTQPTPIGLDDESEVDDEDDVNESYS